MGAAIDAALERLTNPSTDGDAFFGAAAEALCSVLGARWAAFGRVARVEGEASSIDIVAFHADGRLQPPPHDDALAAPFHVVLDGGQVDAYRFWGDGAAAIFSDNGPVPPDEVRSCRGEALYDDDGAALGCVLAMDDRPATDALQDKAFFRLVAQQAAAEFRRAATRRHLAEAEARVNDFTEIASEWWWETDKDDRFSFFSSTYERMTGVDKSKMLGMRREDILNAAPDDFTDDTFTLSDWRRHLDCIARREPFDNVIHPRRMADGSTRYVLNSGRPIYDGSGAFIGYRNVGRDVTEHVGMLRALKAKESSLRSAVVDLQAANETRTALLANISHELRTPLNAILGFAEALLCGMFGKLDEKPRVYLERIYNSGLNLLELVKKILDINAIHRGSREINEEEFDINEAVEAAVKNKYADCIRNGLKISFFQNFASTRINADYYAIYQIVDNLINNAIKFTPHSGEVSVRVDPPSNDGIAFSVADTGVGVALAEREEIFRPFIRGESALTRRQSGAGLGLALVRGLVELHGGAVWVDPDYVRGARFVVHLPAERLREQN